MPGHAIWSNGCCGERRPVLNAAPAWPVLVLTGLALLLWTSHRDAAFRRVRALHRSAGQRQDGTPSAVTVERWRTPRARRWLLPGVAALSVGVLVGGGTGVAVAAGVAVGAERLLRARGADRRPERTALVHELPAACDLLAVCLGAGVPVAGALASVGEATPSPLGPELRAVAALYRLGAEPRRAWLDAPAELAALGRALVRAGESGSTVAPALHALAEDGRSAARAATDAALRRAGVWVLAPLGLCFLPAFVCLGVAPLIIGLAGDLLGS